jgi:hypothetical protein
MLQGASIMRQSMNYGVVADQGPLATGNECHTKKRTVTVMDLLTWSNDREMVGTKYVCLMVIR